MLKSKPSSWKCDFQNTLSSNRLLLKINAFTLVYHKIIKRTILGKKIAKLFWTIYRSCVINIEREGKVLSQGKHNNLPNRVLPQHPLRLPIPPITLSFFWFSTVGNPFYLTSCPYFAKSINVDFVLNILKNHSAEIVFFILVLFLFLLFRTKKRKRKWKPCSLLLCQNRYGLSPIIFTSRESFLEQTLHRHSWRVLHSVRNSCRKGLWSSACCWMVNVSGAYPSRVDNELELGIISQNPF
jgi:hypothetical protein